MTSERIQRQIERLLDEAEAAAGSGDWPHLKELVDRALTLDPDNQDARGMLAAAARGLESAGSSTGSVARAPLAIPPQLTSFFNGRYQVRRFLGEGGKKKVYLAHDVQLDRDVAFALIKTEGLDEAANALRARRSRWAGTG